MDLIFNRFMFLYINEKLSKTSYQFQGFCKVLVIIEWKSIDETKPNSLFIFPKKACVKSYHIRSTYYKTNADAKTHPIFKA